MLRNMLYQIAIDGTVASGKGTVARLLSRKLGILGLDTGALYRGVTVAFQDNKIDLTDPVSVDRALGQIELTVKCIEGETFVFLNGEDITRRLRDNEISVAVPYVAKIPEVRTKVRSVQHDVSTGASLVCEGRDITSVIFPNALFKFYLTAGVKQRAIRRYRELAAKGDTVSLTELTKQIAERDIADMTRQNSPLIRVKDAIFIDTTHATAYAVAKRMEKIITRELVKH